MLKRRPRRIGPDNAVRVLSILSMLIAATPLHALAQESICAQVKIQIEQEATLERQAFDAQMKIANGLDTAALESVGINVTFQDESGATVKATSDPADTSALFFIRIDRM